MTNPSFLVTDPHYRVLGAYNTEAVADGDVAERKLLSAQVVEIATADVATLARIAAGDCPKLTAKGGGFLGEGTHPAQPYLEAMLTMHDVGTRLDPSDIRYGMDDPRRIIITFLSNAATWKGETARTVKARLKEIAK